MSSPAAVSYTIIGNGRVARHFIHYFQLQNLAFHHWHRGLDRELLSHYLDDSSHILVLISDDQIQTFIYGLNTKPEHQLIHFSGCLQIPEAHAVHPLQSFSPTLYTKEAYQSIPFIVESEGPDFNNLLPGLSNPHWRIPKNKKPLYHALCVMANNFTTLLWQKLFNEFENTLNLAPHAANEILKTTLNNLIADPQNALTGPIARGDTNTIKKNLSALKSDPYFDVYNAFVKASGVHFDEPNHTE